MTPDERALADLNRELDGVRDLISSIDVTRARAESRRRELEGRAQVLRLKITRERIDAAAAASRGFDDMAAASERFRRIADEAARRYREQGAYIGDQPNDFRPPFGHPGNPGYDPRDGTYGRTTTPPGPRRKPDTAAQTKARSTVAKLLERANHRSTPKGEAATCRDKAAELTRKHNL